VCLYLYLSNLTMQFLLFERLYVSHEDLPFIHNSDEIKLTCLIFHHFHLLLCVPVILPAGADAMAFGVLIAKDEPSSVDFVNWLFLLCYFSQL
jgi:hypothetical protein